MPRTLRAQAAIAVGLLLCGCGLAWWSLATDRLTPGTLTLRSLAVLGAYTLLVWARDLAQTLRRAYRRR